ncbi:MAG: hypothetical protein ACO1OQ_05125 [Rufibacter sp.]
MEKEEESPLHSALVLCLFLGILLLGKATSVPEMNIAGSTTGAQPQHYGWEGTKTPTFFAPQILVHFLNLDHYVSPKLCEAELRLHKMYASSLAYSQTARKQQAPDWPYLLKVTTTGHLTAIHPYSMAVAQVTY